MQALFGDNVKFLNTAGTTGPVSTPVYQIPNHADLVREEFNGPCLLIIDQQLAQSPAIHSLKSANFA